MLNFKQEFDYEALIAGCSIQDITETERSFELVQYDDEECKEIQRKYNERQQILLAKLAEKVNLKNSFLQLQIVLNNRIIALHQEINKICEEHSADLDNYINSLADVKVTIENNSRKESDKSSVSKKIAKCSEKIDDFEQMNATFFNTYKKFEANLIQDFYQAAVHISDLNKSLNSVTVNNLREVVRENQEQLGLLKKNIDFLNQKTRELQEKCNGLTSAKKF